MLGKIILMDYGYYLHASGWYAVSSGNKPSYTCFNMMLADLLKVGIEPEDIVIVGIDYHGEDYSSWRKQFVEEYKEGRVKLPTEIYQELNELAVKLNESTEWYFIKLNHLEFDDIAAVATRYYTEKGQGVVIISADCDMHQLWIYEGVKLYSPHKKSKCYKIKPDNFNIFKLLHQKTCKEAKDQVTSEILNTEEYDSRRLIMDLTNLPDWIEILVRGKLKTLEYKHPDFRLMPFQKLSDKYSRLYEDKSKVVTYEQSLKKEQKKKDKIKKKAREKKLAKKLAISKMESKK